MAIDLETLPGLVCGQTYRDERTERLAPSTRQDEVTSYTGCGKPMAWLQAYRCRQCGRWMHGGCLDFHFGDSEAVRTQPAASAEPLAESAHGRAGEGE